MTYPEMKSIITNAVGEGFDDQYSTRAGELIVNVMSELIKSKEYSEYDIPELVVNQAIFVPNPAEIQYLGVTNDLTGNPNVLDIIKVYENDTHVLSGYRYIEKTHAFATNMRGNTNLDPVTGVYYFYLEDGYIFFINTSAIGKNVKIKYVVTPVSSTWTGEMVGLYSLSFLERIINICIERLSSEVDR